MSPSVPLLFIERMALSEPVSVEVDRPRAVHPIVTGFWRDDEYHRVLKIVETRYEYGETFWIALSEPVSVEVDRPRAVHPIVTGFWRDDEYHRVLKIVETRYEYGETFFRVV